MLINYLKRQKAAMVAHRTNAFGKNLTGRFLIIESDDWGAIRTPSRDALVSFEKKGLELAKSIYKNDSLASNTDLDELFNLLESIRDCNGKSLTMTANVILANPDFARIKESSYQSFFYEDFRKTIQRYPEHHLAFSKWQQAIEAGVFMPQFHGREHLQYKRWLKVLQAGNAAALFCFDHGATYSGKADYSFMEAFDWDLPEDVEDQKQVLAEGLELFKKVFGFESKTFIAPCYNWDPLLETVLKEKGIRLIQGLRNQLAPTGSFGQYKSIPHYLGEANELGLKYSIRNCFLEPSQLPGKDWVDSCLAQIQTAFFWKKPAVICSHRINYIGYIDPRNSERGLRDLKLLMKQVLLKWPDVQFITTEQLCGLI